MEKILNAKIKFTNLSGYGYNDNNLTLVMGFDVEKNQTYQTEKLLINPKQIKTILSVLELNAWEELPRKFARIKVEIPGNKIIAVGNLLDERWVNLYEN